MEKRATYPEGQDCKVSGSFHLEQGTSQKGTFEFNIQMRWYTLLTIMIFIFFFSTDMAESSSTCSPALGLGYVVL